MSGDVPIINKRVMERAAAGSVAGRAAGEIALHWRGQCYALMETVMEWTGGGGGGGGQGAWEGGGAGDTISNSWRAMDR